MPRVASARGGRDTPILRPMLWVVGNSSALAIVRATMKPGTGLAALAVRISLTKLTKRTVPETAVQSRRAVFVCRTSAADTAESSQRGAV